MYNNCRAKRLLCSFWLHPRYEMPAYVLRGGAEGLHLPPAYQRNDYIGWITCAKQAATREKRLRPILDELSARGGYINLFYNAKKP